MAFGAQFLLLLLKNLKIKGRNLGGTIVEALFPLMCLSLLLGLFIMFSRGADGDPSFKEIPIPSLVTTARNRSSLAYAPDIPIIKELLTAAFDGRSDLLHPVKTEDELDVVLNQERDSLRLFAGIFFHLTEEEYSTGNISNSISYAIRFPGQFFPNPAVLTQFISNSNVSPNVRYLAFLSVQQNVDRAISELKIKEILGTSVTLNLTGSVGRFPLQIGEADLDSRWQARDVIIKPVAGTWFTFCLLFTVYRLVSTIMVEKRTKVRDSMRMMGMRSEFYWLTWLLVSILMVIPILIVCSILLKVLNIFPRSSFDVIFLTWFLYGTSLITFAMLFSSFLNSVKSSGILTILALVVLSIAGSAIVTAKIDTDYKIVLSLFSPVAYNLAVNILATAENQKIPMDYSHANDVFDGLPSLNAMFGMLICDTVLYLFLAWYIDNVSSGGAKQPWNFFCRRSYWSKKVPTAYTHLLDDDGIGETINTRNFEHVDGMGKPVVRIDKLRKVFDIAGQKFIAVDGFKLDLYENQLVALLGHNGAGKTTLISMLTGTVDPTAGDAEMDGHSLLKDLSSLKKLIGICPQHDAIWPQLTVYEHLQLFAGFKGVPFNQLKTEAEQLIKDFELEDKRNYPAGKLSGGQKRKLSIAIALIGGSKVVFLDEPTSGMDPEGRRTVWDLLSKYKAGRVIILTTHFMDEADYLGDRIAIMRHGKLLTAGSSLFLKNRFGLGYTLTCVKKPSCNVDALASFLNSNSPNIQLLSNAGAEVIFRIPRKSLEDLPQLLGGLERQKDNLGLTTYGIGQSTLEEVFLELNQESDKPLELSLNNTVFIPASEPSKRRQLSALLRKRAQFAKRDGKFLFIQFAVPIITCIIAFLVQTFVFVPNTSFATEVTFNGSIYSSYLSPWANYNDCSTNFFSALPQYTTELFPNFSPSDLEQRIADPATNASGAVINNMCSSTPSSIENLQYTLLYNASMTHSLPYYQNLMSNAVLNKMLGGIGLVNITTISQPIGSAVNMENNLISIIILFLILMGLGVLSASTTAFILQERELGVKQLQLASGTNPIIYWLSNFIWDFILHIIIFIAIFIVAAAINWTTFGGNRLGAEAVLVICYSLASVSIAYFLTFVFSGAGSGQGAALGLFLGLGFAFLVTIATTSSIIGNSSDAPQILDYIFRALSPHYLFVLSLGQLSNNVGTVTLVEKNSNLFDISLWGSSYLYLIGQFVVYGSLTLILENVTKIRLATAKFLTRARHDVVDGSEDHDVKAERQLVDSANLSDNENNLIWVKGLRKEFNARKKIRKVAVDNFSLCIPRGECFGLLGANGAGKTTTLRMVSGQLLPTNGEVSVNGHSYQELDEIRKSIGFCPQFDSIIPKLSGRAHLELFAELRGLPKEEIPNIVNAIIAMIHLEKYADRPCGKYSGGNKRKLSLAIALIGNPPVLYLDEPSTGMDPLARRFMWNLIMAVRSNKAIILTTHSMEECEALCTRLGIMIGGKLKCLGSPQHLKTKFGNGYRLELKTDLQHAESIPKFLEELSPDARLVDNHTTMFNYEIPMSSLTLGQLFEHVERVKEDLNIVDYAVSQTTLEQIFITMAQEYNHPLTDVVINQ